MPHSPRSHQLENQSRTRLRQLFDSVNWIVNEIHEDYGEDLLIRIVEGTEVTPYFFLVQVKATDNIRKLKTTTGIVKIPIRTDTAKVWNGLATPLFVILWDAQADVLYWSHVQKFFHTQAGRDALNSHKKKVRIPVVNCLTADDLPMLTVIVKQATIWATTTQQPLEMLQTEYKKDKSVMYGIAALAISNQASEAELLQVLQSPESTIGLRLRDLSGRVLHSSTDGHLLAIQEILMNSIDATETLE